MTDDQCPQTPLSEEAQQWRDEIAREVTSGSLSHLPSVTEQLSDHCERLGIAR